MACRLCRVCCCNHKATGRRSIKIENRLSCQTQRSTAVREISTFRRLEESLRAYEVGGADS